MAIQSFDFRNISWKRGKAFIENAFLPKLVQKRAYFGKILLYSTLGCDSTVLHNNFILKNEA